LASSQQTRVYRFSKLKFKGGTIVFGGALVAGVALVVLVLAGIELDDSVGKDESVTGADVDDEVGTVTVTDVAVELITVACSWGWADSWKERRNVPVESCLLTCFGDFAFSCLLGITPL